RPAPLRASLLRPPAQPRLSAYRRAERLQRRALLERPGRGLPARGALRPGRDRAAARARAASRLPGASGGGRGTAGGRAAPDRDDPAAAVVPEDRSRLPTRERQRRPRTDLLPRDPARHDRRLVRPEPLPADRDVRLRAVVPA